jgi:hypothetical protein
MVSYIILLKLKNPFAELRQWARPFRYAGLGTGCLATILRCLGSDAISVSKGVIDVLAMAILILLVVALTSAVIAFEHGILMRARKEASGALRARQAANRLSSGLRSQGIEMNERSDRTFLSNVRESFQFHENPFMRPRDESGAKCSVNVAVQHWARPRPQQGEAVVVTKTARGHISEIGAGEGEALGDGISQKDASINGCNPTRDGKRETFMPEGWQKAMSEEGHRYYIDPDQNSQWEKPPGQSSPRETSPEIEREEETAEILSVRRMILSAHSMATHVCLHANCGCVATFGKRSEPVAKRCRSHKHKGDVLKLRMNTKEKRGEWEELVDNENGKTYYFNERLDVIQFEKPQRWVRMLAEQIEKRKKLGRGCSQGVGVV